MLKLKDIFCFLVLISSSLSEDRGNETEEIKYLARMIEEGLANAFTYTLPTSADMYAPNTDKVIDYEPYDFIIIGSGATGSVIASRLSERKNLKVLVLEAGEWPDYSFLQFLSYLYPSTLSKYNWGFKSIPQTTACLGMVDQRCNSAQGKGIGGTTLINGAIYCRADPKVLDKWAELLADPSWSYENVLRLYKKSENFTHTNPWAPIDEAYHGYEGPLDVEQVLPPDELSGVFLEAHRKLGFKVADHNGPDADVASIYQLYSKNGKRHDTGAAFLKPVLQRNNLKVLTESYVTTIDIDKSTKVARGVTFTRHGKIYHAKANKEIILSAGVFQSPRILMSSGIGPRKHLQALGIDVVEDLDVGSALTDDVINQSLLFSSKLYLPAQTMEEKIKDYLHGYGPLTGAASSQGTAWHQSELDNATGFVDIHLYGLTAAASAMEVKVTNWKNDSYYAAWGNTENAIEITMIHVNPYSRGTVRLESNDPFRYPLIDFNFLSDRGDRDIATMYEGIKLIFKLMKTAPFQRLGVKYEGKPVPGCQNHKFLSKSYWYCFLRQTSSSGYHASGTCPMGVDPRKGAVVDSNLKVFGVKRLRVADSSVFPTTSARPPSSTCIMIGEKIAEVIKAQYK